MWVNTPYMDDMGFCLKQQLLSHATQKSVTHVFFTFSDSYRIMYIYIYICLQKNKIIPSQSKKQIVDSKNIFPFFVDDFFIAFQPGFVSDTTGRSLRYEFLIFTLCSNGTLLQSWFWSGLNTEPHRVWLEHYGLKNFGPLNFFDCYLKFETHTAQCPKMHHVFPRTHGTNFCRAHTLKPQMTLRWICLCRMLETNSETYFPKCCFFSAMNPLKAWYIP